MNRLTAFVILCICLGCVTPGRVEPKVSMKRYFDNAKMEAEVRKYISEGMPVNQAKQIMEDSGFKCEERVSWINKPPALRCTGIYPRSWAERWNAFLMADVIDVYLSHEAGIVKGIEVTCWSDGP